MAGDGFSCQGTHDGIAFEVRREDQGSKILNAALAAADFEQGPDDGTHHVAQEPVGFDAEIPIVIPAFASRQRCQAACDTVQTDVFESAPVFSKQRKSCCPRSTNAASFIAPKSTPGKAYRQEKASMNGSFTRCRK